MLKFNTFRAQRYLRSRYVEGRFLLASEAGDLELESLDVLRKVLSDQIGDIAVDDAFKVEKLSNDQLIINPGVAWIKGLPFIMEGGKDHLVSPSNTLGIVKVVGGGTSNITLTEDTDGDGKILNFNSGGSTPAGTYRVVISAEEELITNSEDPFIKNANITESTAQKVRLVLKVNLVIESEQDNSPTPYTSETDGNLINEVVITPSPGSGDLLASNLVPGAEEIDGRDVELIISNPASPSPSNVLPTSLSEQSSFKNGKLIDSKGSVFHVNEVFNDIVSGQVVIRIDLEVGQSLPEIVNSEPYTIQKKDVHSQNDTTGNPEGTVFWPIGTVVWDGTDFIHESSITDLRNKLNSQYNFQNASNQKDILNLSGGDAISFVPATSFLTWATDFNIINPSGPDQIITADSVPIVDKGSLVYELDLVSGGVIEKGVLAVTVSAVGATSTLSGLPDLSTAAIGNIIVDSGGDVAEITAIDDIADTVTTSPALTNTGAATIYLDSYGPGTAPVTLNSYVLASRNGTDIQHNGVSLIEGGQLALDRQNSIWDAIVGTTAQVTSGVATHDVIQDAINAVSSGDKILLLDETFTENISVDKTLYIEGRGHDTVIDGTVTFTSSSDFTNLSGLKIVDDITFDSGSDSNYLKKCWVPSGISIIDNGLGNDLEIIEE